MQHGLIWLALGYNTPAELSRHRVYVWRKLKECGAGHFRPGVALLPANAESMAKFRSLAAKIREMGGEAVIAELKFCDHADEAETVSRFRKSSEGEYRDIIRDSRRLMSLGAQERAEALKKLEKSYGKIRARDYFGTRDSLAQGLTDLADDMERVTAGLGRQLRRLLEL
jgi:hypothetical protein